MHHDNELAAGLRRIRAALERHAGRDGPSGSAGDSPDAGEDGGSNPSPVKLLCELFDLSDFERDILLMCAGIELDADLAATVSRLQDGAPPTFSLALAALDQAHWSALLPTGPLRYWGLIELTSGASLVGSAIRIDERILHYLLGLQYLDERLAAFVSVAVPPSDLAPSHLAVAARISASWQSDGGDSELPPINLTGADEAARLQIASWAAACGGAALLLLHAADLPEDQQRFDRLGRRFARETLLTSGCMMILCDPQEASSRVRQLNLERLVKQRSGAIILSSDAPLTLGRTSVLRFDVDDIAQE